MYIVYHKETTRSLFWESYGGVQLFRNEAAAKGALTREVKKRKKANDAYREWLVDREENPGKCGWMNKPRELIDRDDYLIAEARYFAENIEKQQPVTNLMSGKVVMESVNTPNFLSVGSETYWQS